MAVSMVLGRTMTLDGVSVTNNTNTVSDSGVHKFSDSVPAGTVAMPVKIACLKTAITGVVIGASQPAHIFTNNATEGSATDVFIVSPNNDIQWSSTSPTACPFTANITEIFVTVPGATAATVSIAILYHAQT